MELKINLNEEVLSKLENYLDFLKKQWDIAHPNSNSWFSISKNYILDCTIFLVSVLDDLIVFVQSHVEKGSDKKHIVMSMSSDIFDYIVLNAFPIWLKPFASLIKEIVINIIISQFIEFIVKKYKEGSWKQNDLSNPPDVVQSSIVYCSRKEL